MSLVTHAKEELNRAGLFDKDSDYDGMLGGAVLELVETFAKQGHSGYSAMLVLDIFDKVAKFQPLTPITNDPKEWMGVTGELWQSKRNPSLFSRDKGETWYDVNDQDAAQ